MKYIITIGSTVLCCMAAHALEPEIAIQPYDTRPYDAAGETLADYMSDTAASNTDDLPFTMPYFEWDGVSSTVPDGPIQGDDIPLPPDDDMPESEAPTAEPDQPTLPAGGVHY